MSYPTKYNRYINKGIPLRKVMETQQEWNEKSQEEKYRAELEEEVKKLRYIAERFEQFQKQTSDIFFELCREEENILVDYGGGINSPSNTAIKLSQMNHKMIGFKMSLDDMSFNLRMRLDSYDDKFGKLLRGE